jgi:hypothetical protein
MNTPQVNAQSEADSFPIAQPKVVDSGLRISAVLGGSDSEPEEHVLFVLHPARMEKGDLL